MSFESHKQKMEAHQLNSVAVEMFRKNFETLTENKSCMISESTINPASGITSHESISNNTVREELLGETVLIKLNGGLGTSMGLQGVKSALEVKEGTSFLDAIVQQVQTLRKETGQNMKLLFMNSFSTSEETLSLLKKYEADGFADRSEVELMQNQIPKICQETLEPITWEKDPAQEWCPPGHADVYTALLGSGWLDRLIADGINYAFISNSDNLGATLDPHILTYIADENIPFLMEVTRRTEADSKGGHLAKRASDGQMLLREVAQCPDEDLDSFQDITKHQFFNTNNLWLHLPTLKKVLDEQGGVMDLPVILNSKTVDPRDKTSPKVYQLETAMGSAIECVPGASALDVPRSRFAPVKKTTDLLAIRSDAYEQNAQGQVQLAPARKGVPPMIKLSDEYKFVDSIANMGTPSLVEAELLKVSGKVQFSEGVVIKGKVEITNDFDQAFVVPAGIYENKTLLASELTAV